MEKLTIKQTDIETSRLVYGCMRIAGDGTKEDLNNGKQAIRAAIDAGYNHFDHADIYAKGMSEQLFGEVLKESNNLREKLVVTSKAGIRFANTPNQGDVKRYDFSEAYLIKSVEGSLKRLNTEYLDLFLLHRPDYLMQPEEVAKAFSHLKASGKVKHFGVSNFTPSQVELLQSALDMPLVCNQVEINLHNISALENGVLDQCQTQDITPMAWCPIAGIAYPAWGNTFTDEAQQRLIQEAQRQAQQYDCEPWIIAFAWLLTLPANVLPIVGSTNVERIFQAKQALEINYRREDWYRLLEARNGHPVP